MAGRKKKGTSVERQLLTALRAHTVQLRKHSKALDKTVAGQKALTTALQEHTASLNLALQQPRNVPGQKEQAIMDCITSWLQQHGKLPDGKEADPEATMNGTYHFNGPPEITNFLNGVCHQLAQKHYTYNAAADTSSLTMLTKLVTATVTSVAFEISKNTALSGG